MCTQNQTRETALRDDGFSSLFYIKTALYGRGVL